jgi:hypothetical protein
MKEEHFLEKMKEMLLEEERLWVPVAQGLPWSTNEPEVSIFTYSHSAQILVVCQSGQY